MKNEELEIQNNLLLKTLKDTDSLQLVCTLFLVLFSKENIPNFKKLSFSQFNNKIKTFRTKNIAISHAYNLVVQDAGFQDYYQSILDFVCEKERSLVVDILTHTVIEYFEKNNYFYDDIENLTKRYLTDNINNLALISCYPARFVFEKYPAIANFYFNFFNDNINLLTMIFFELQHKEYFLVNLENYSNLKNLSLDNIIFIPPYKDQQALQRLSLFNRNGIDYLTSSFEWKIIDYLFGLTNNNGRFVSIISSSVLNKISDYPYRKKLVNDNSIFAVVELPRIALSSAFVSFVVLQKESIDNIKVVNAMKFGQNLRKGTSIDSERIIRSLDGLIEFSMKNMDKNYLINSDYDLTPHRFFEKTSTEFPNPTELKDVTDSIFRGYQIPSELLDEYVSKDKTKIKLLTLSDIEDGFVNTKDMLSLKSIDKKMEHYILQENDLVISCKGKTFKTAVISIPYGETYISTGSVIVIRCRDNLLDPTYLKVFLDSQYGIKALRRIQTGGKVLSLNPSKLLTITIPVPHFSKQLIISSSYKYKKQNIEEVKEALENMKKEIEKKFDMDFLNLLE